MTAATAATPCTSAQKQQMLSTITTDAQWPTCQKATAPYDFYKSLTQVQLFASTPACATVYNGFQAAIKAANCDEVQNLTGLAVAPFVQLTSPPTTNATAPTTTLATTTPTTTPTTTTTTPKSTAPVHGMMLTAAITALALSR
ncbi:hypothetical protein SPRG_14981 [Saprolegnia parasitica CBS 223.65]|uniref:Uncharacterized protein n=1 Tax=Saprolegnia parasitica (strain CBS 223.65) TaxID=695850 RepID=A0A067BZ03_SAPPC|nr:hypothetical protein SPRG_14981 [Saprolegnia parasitica CBS 223.65]KDO19787.1 hypothetical protein SPRG_14981 [Saprolegnia parasitica CBS 223.65]|eukprot:XP_012209495.1 hypothetical protein SPRG_14981 [Saprolegnia parasitica CBS 223.65]